MYGWLNRVFYELKFSGKLPSPDGVGMQILQLTQQEDCGLHDIIRVVRSDPSLTGRILKVANSLTGGGTPAGVPLEDAVLRIGFASLRDLVLGFSLVSNNHKAVCRGFDYGGFWHMSLGRAVAAQYLTELAGEGSPSESYVCGLLCGMGRLGMAAAHPDRYGALLASPEASDPDALAALESRTFGINHRELTRALLGDWGFPDRLAQAAATYQERVREDDSAPRHLQALRRTLGVAESVAGELGAGATGERHSEDLHKALLGLDVPEGQIGQMFDSVRAIWKEWGALLNVSAPKPVRPVPVVAPGDRGGDRVAAEDSAGAETRGSVGAGAGGSVLMLLESDDRLAAVIESWVRPAGHTVVRARTVREALAAAVTHAPAIAIARGAQGDAEALELCRALRSFEAGRLTFFILATVARDPCRLLEAFDAGVDDYLVLPGTDGDGLLRLRAAQRVLELRARVVAQEKTLQQNLAELAVANRKLHRTAMTDALTQLPNRRFAEETLRDLWEEAVTQNTDLALIAGDLDGFKKVNDTHGHMVGDLVLASVARVLRQELRQADVACRMGGEEFLVICPGTDLAGAIRCAERLRQRVAASFVEVAGHRLQITISLGVATRRGRGIPASSLEAVIAAADAASYESKRAGKNRVSAKLAA